ncbi:MAG: hypothetical protein MJ164_00690 [Alphaproteobacteria bacterium]|nr:hypothetical protein [Alphaproteobacteria bacterium]
MNIIIPESIQVPKPCVRKLAKFEKTDISLNHNKKVKNVKKRKIKPVARRNTTHKMTVPYAVDKKEPTKNITKKTAYIIIKLFPEEHRTPKYILVGRKKKNVLKMSNQINIHDFEHEKQKNLEKLVAEYEASCAEKAKQKEQTNAAFQIIADKKLCDYLLHQDAIACESFEQAANYFNTIELQTIQHYKHVVKQHNQSEIIQIIGEYDMPQNPSKHDLRMMVHAFNQHTL